MNTELFHVCHAKTVLSFPWIRSWVPTVSEIIRSLQHDASLRATRAFACSVPQGIRNDAAIRLALVINVSKDVPMYQWFHHDLLASHRSPRLALPAKPVLSDQASSFPAFCARNGMSQHADHRHLSELASALRENSERAHRDHCDQSLADATALLDTRMVTEGASQQFVSFLSHDFPHGTWHRMDDCISTCSIHAERFQGVIKQY
jgi:hypothetical protein